MLNKKASWYFCFLKNHLLQKQNVLKVFLAAVLYLALFGGAQTASASTITIGGDHFLTIDGKKQFVVSGQELCSHGMDTAEYSWFPSCSVAVSMMSNFTYASTEFREYWEQDFQDHNIATLPIFENSNVFFDLFNGDTGGMVISDDDLDRSVNTLQASTNFFGYDNRPTEIKSDAEFLTHKQAYNRIKAHDPNHPVVMHNMDIKSNTGSISVFELGDIWDKILYTYEVNCGSTTSFQFVWDAPCGAKSVYDNGYYLDDFLYYKNKELMQELSRGGYTSVDSAPKPIMFMTSSVSEFLYEGANAQWPVVPAREVRLEGYWTVIVGGTGIHYWSMRGGISGSGIIMYGVIANAAVAKYYNDFAGEITSDAMSVAITAPTVAYSWRPVEGEWNNAVTFSNNAFVYKGTYMFGYPLIYRLKYDSNSGRYYLFVINQDNSPKTNTQITIAGLSGTMTARTLGVVGTGSSAPGRTLAVTNGKFADTFDGHAAHVYEICVAGDPCTVPIPPPPDTTTPGQSTPTPVPPTPTPAYVTPTLYCLGLGINSCMTLAIQTPIPSTTQSISGPTPTQTPSKNPPAIDKVFLLVPFAFGIIIYYLLTRRKT